MLSKDLEVTLNLAFKEARSKRHEWMTVEHLLLALLDNSVAVDVLKAVGADIDRLRKELHEFIESTTPLIPAGDSERETQPTLGFQRVLQRARDLGHRHAARKVARHDHQPAVARVIVLRRELHAFAPGPPFSRFSL